MNTISVSCKEALSLFPDIPAHLSLFPPSQPAFPMIPAGQDLFQQEIRGEEIFVTKGIEGLSFRRYFPNTQTGYPVFDLTGPYQWLKG